MKIRLTIVFSKHSRVSEVRELESMKRDEVEKALKAQGHWMAKIFNKVKLERV